MKPTKDTSARAMLDETYRSPDRRRLCEPAPTAPVADADRTEYERAVLQLVVTNAVARDDLTSAEAIPDWIGVIAGALKESRPVWSPPGAARAGDELTEAEQEILIDALLQDEPAGRSDLAYMDLVRPVVDSIAPAFARILAARAGGAGGDLAERVRARAEFHDHEALAYRERMALVKRQPSKGGRHPERADAYDLGLNEGRALISELAARDLRALLEPAPADGSES